MLKDCDMAGAGGWTPRVNPSDDGDEAGARRPQGQVHGAIHQEPDFQGASQGHARFG
jgi:hypothetical protein